MKALTPSLLALAAMAAALAVSAPSPMAQAGSYAGPHAGPGEPQGEARRDMRAGKVRSLREIEQHVLPMMQGMQYLGPEYDPVAVAYRLKFIKGGRVVFVDVDARSGEVIRQSR